jgi:DEAD/DEAH box helicase domain-containing protein
MSTLSMGLEKLKEAGLPPPDEIGYELPENGVVIAEAELAWTAKRVVLLLKAQATDGARWSENSWTPIIEGDCWAESLASALHHDSDR